MSSGCAPRFLPVRDFFAGRRWGSAEGGVEELWESVRSFSSSTSMR